MSHDPLRPSPDPAPTDSPHEIVPVQEKDKTRAAWTADERHVLPENRFWIVIPGLMCCIFLAALDQVRSQLCLYIIRFAHCSRPLSQLLYRPSSNTSAAERITAGLEGTPPLFFHA